MIEIRVHQHTYGSHTDNEGVGEKKTGFADF